MQRHVNYLLLAYFLKQVLPVTQEQATRLQCCWFFCANEGGDSPAQRLVAWLEECQVKMPEYLQQGLKAVVAKTTLETSNLSGLLQQATEVMAGKPEKTESQEKTGILEKWLSEYEPFESRI